MVDIQIATLGSGQFRRRTGNIASGPLLTPAGKTPVFTVTHSDWTTAGQSLRYHVQETRDGVRWRDVLYGWGVTDPVAETVQEFTVNPIAEPRVYRIVVEVTGAVTFKLASRIE